MRQTYFVLYSSVATQAATALLLSCSLFVLGRYYPRNFLRLWSGAWLAEAVHLGLGILLVLWRAPGGSPAGMGQQLASWITQTAGFSHAALLLLGALAFHRRERHESPAWPRVVVVAAIAALLPVFAAPLESTPQAVEIRLIARVGVMAVVGLLAAVAAAFLVRRRFEPTAALGVRWMFWLLLLIGLHHAVVAALAVSVIPRSSPAALVVTQILPLAGILLTAALGIGTAIALVEDEQVAVRRGAQREIDAERRSRASDASLVSALSAIPDLVAVIGNKSELVAWNPAFEAFARRHNKAAPGTGVSMLDIVPASVKTEWTARIAGLISGEDQTFDTEIQQAESAPEFFDVSARPIRDGSDVVGGVIVARDVTERRRLELQLQQSQRLDTVGRLAGGIAHDFNNLLTAILSSTSVAREILPPDHEVQADLADVQLAGERATQLTRQLLAFARRQPVSQQPMDLNDRISAMERMLSRLVGPAIAVRVTLGDTLWHVRADGPQLEQVLVNIAVNARDAMPNGGRLTVRTGNRVVSEGAIMSPRPMPAGDYVEIVISDTGTGMDAETLAHVFEPFYTTKAVGQGTGLGLAMCYGIIRQHHGVIWIESAIGRGTTVFILLPRYDGPLPSAVERPASEKPTQIVRGTESILLVEDEPQVRAVAARALRSVGYRVLEATNGRDGIQVARRERDGIDMIISDIVMPEMGGREMLALARQFLPRAAVLFVSGYSAGTLPTSSDDPPGGMLLQKPFTPHELLSAVRTVLDRHAAVQDSPSAIVSP